MPGFLSDLGIGDVVMDVGELLRLRVLRPQSLRAAKIRNPGLGGDSGAGEDHDALGVLDPYTDGGDPRLRRAHSRARSGARRGTAARRPEKTHPGPEGHKVREHGPYSEQQATEHLTGLQGPADVVEGKAVPDARLTRPEGDPVRRARKRADHQGPDPRPPPAAASVHPQPPP